MNKTKLTAVSLGLLALLLGGLQVNDTLKTPSYIQCREGMSYGEWIEVNQYQFRCSLNNETSLCWKTTKTRCYLFDDDVIFSSLPKNAHKVKCDSIKCIEVL